VFTVSAQPANAINPDASVSFSIQYAPTTEKEDSATITIINNSGASPFIFTVKGSCHEKKPQITIKQGATTINPNGEYDFGTVATTDVPKTVTFTIGNSGEANLTFVTVDGSRVNLGNNAADHFTVTQPSSSVVPIDGTTTFTVSFNPRAEGSNLNATVQIKTNSRDNSDFSFTVKGDGYVKKPQITIQHGSTTINPHGEYNFGTVATVDTNTITFIIGNSGEADLTFVTVDGNRINLGNNTAGHFTVNQPSSSSVIPGGTTTFTVSFNPKVEENNLTATVQIRTNSLANDDFTFTVKGNGYEKRPQIALRQGTSIINSLGEFDFDIVKVGKTKDVIFTIENTGEINLNIESVNGNRINLENNTNNLFAVSLQPSTPVASDGTTSFTIRFSPQIEGSITVTARIKTDSKYDDDFSFTVRGTGFDYHIGDTGPGGGIIFFAEGDTYKECSGELGPSGTIQYLNASGYARSYSGGGFSDWALPDIYELASMYNNLKKNNLGGFFNDWYWSSTVSAPNIAVGNFTDGTIGAATPSTYCRVRAVRTFTF
jgi:hypothetical protein